MCQACLHPSTPPFIESCAVGYFDYHRFKKDARSTPGGVLGLFLTSCECSESWTLEALLVTSLAFLLTPFPSVSLWFPLLPLITTFQFSQASNSPTVSSIWLLTLPPRRGPQICPLLLKSWMALGGMPGLRCPSIQLGEWWWAPAKVAVISLGPVSKQTPLWMPWVLATPTRCIVDQQPGSDAEAEEFPFSLDLGMGVASLAVSDTLCY